MPIVPFIGSQPYLAQLGDRMRARAAAGRIVSLTPDTASRVATALYMVCEAPLHSEDVTQSYRCIVADWTFDGVPTVLAYTRNTAIQNAAFEAAVKEYPERKIVARWFQMTGRRSWQP